MFAFSHSKTAISLNILLEFMILCLRNIYFQVSNYMSLSLSLKLYYQNKQTIITEYTIVTILVKGDHKIAKVLIVCGSLCTQL